MEDDEKNDPLFRFFRAAFYAGLTAMLLLMALQLLAYWRPVQRTSIPPETRIAELKTVPRLPSHPERTSEPEGSMSQTFSCLACSDLGDGIAAWFITADGTNPANASIDDEDGNTPTARFTMGANAFSLASDAVGVKVSINWIGQSPGTTTDVKIRLTQGGSTVGTNQAFNASLPASQSFTDYGGSTNVWGFGGNIPQATINSSTFGVDIQLGRSGGGGGTGPYIAEVDITVYDSGGGLGSVVPEGWLTSPTTDAAARQTAIIGQFARRNSRLAAEVAADQSRQLDIAPTLSPEAPHPEAFEPTRTPVKRHATAQPWLLPNEAHDPTSLTLVGVLDPHAVISLDAMSMDNAQALMNRRLFEEERAKFAAMINGQMDPGSLVLPNAPEPIHGENYPPSIFLPNQRPKPEAQMFPAMAPTDYTGLLPDEAAHPEAMKQMAPDLPPRQPERQYQPPMERNDPGAGLASRDTPLGFDHTLAEVPMRERPHAQQPPIDTSYFVWATPGDPSLYPDQFAMHAPQRAFERERRQPRPLEDSIIDSWSASQIVPPAMWLPVFGPRELEPPSIQSGQTPPEHFRDAAQQGWETPLTRPVHPLPHVLDNRDSGETVDLALVMPETWQPMEVPATRLHIQPQEPPAAEAQGLPAALDPAGWQSQLDATVRTRHRALTEFSEALPQFVEITSADATVLEPMRLPMLQHPQPLAGQPAETQVIPPTGTGAYPIADYVVPMSLPVFAAPERNQQPIGSFAYQDDAPKFDGAIDGMDVPPVRRAPPAPRADAPTPYDEETVVLVTQWEQPMAQAIPHPRGPLPQQAETSIYDSTAQAPPLDSYEGMQQPRPRARRNDVSVAPNMPLPVDPLAMFVDFEQMPGLPPVRHAVQQPRGELVIAQDATPVPPLVEPMDLGQPGRRLAPRIQLPAAEPALQPGFVEVVEALEYQPHWFAPREQPHVVFQADPQNFGEVPAPAGYEQPWQIPQRRANRAALEAPQPAPFAPQGFQTTYELASMALPALPARERRQPESQHPIAPPVANAVLAPDSMDAAAALLRHREAPPVVQPSLVVDQQFFAEAPSPAGYDTVWPMPLRREVREILPFETISTTAFYATGNPPAYAGSTSFIVARGAIYPVLYVAAGKIIGGQRGM